MPTACEPCPGKRKTIGKVELVIQYAHVGTATLSSASSRSMVSFTLPSANSAATRTAFLMAFVFDDPCVMMHTPFMPSSGAPLLGIKGVCIITHGSSNTNAIKNAVRVAAEFAEGKVNE